jgi:hypothetical protein
MVGQHLQNCSGKLPLDNSRSLRVLEEHILALRVVSVVPTQVNVPCNERKKVNYVAKNHSLLGCRLFDVWQEFSVQPADEGNTARRDGETRMARV